MTGDLPTFIDVELADVLDIGLVAVLVYGLLVSLRRAHVGAIAAILIGLAVVYSAAQILGLRLTENVVRLMLALAGISLVIMYHGELRTAIERFVQRLGRRRRPAAPASDAPVWVVPLVASLAAMAREKIGGLVIVRGSDDLHRHITGGTRLDGRVSEALLRSIFDPNSLGHDGAVVIEDGRIAIFQAHLPLSKDTEQLGQRGTRHAAALGLAEQTDALCVAVSEERGSISIAQAGRFREVAGASGLEREIEEYLRAMRGDTRSAEGFWSWRQMQRRVAAVVVSCLLWFVFVHGGETAYRSYMVPVEFFGLEEGLEATRPNPPVVKVILSGPRRAFYLVGGGDVRVRTPLFDLRTGTYDVTLTASDVSTPSALELTNIFPRAVVVTVEREGDDEEGEATAR